VKDQNQESGSKNILGRQIIKIKRQIEPKSEESKNAEDDLKPEQARPEETITS